MTPSMVWPRRSAALYTKTGMASGVFLGDAQDFLDRRQPLARAAPAVHAQRDHPGRDGVLPDVARRRPTQHQAARVLGDRDQLVDAHAPAVAGAAAFVATLAAEELGVVRCHDAEGVEVSGARRVGHAAGCADPTHEPLREHGLQHGGDEIGLHAHVLKPRDRGRRVVGVQRREHEVAGERRLDGDLGRFQVADLADEDHVGVLAHDVAQTGRERQPDLRLHGDLVDALQLVLDGVLDRDDLALRRVDLVERLVERGRLAGAGGPGDQDDPVRALDQRVETLERVGREAELVERQEHARALQQPHDDRLAVHGGDGGHADVHARAVQVDADAAILRQPPLGDVHLGHDLDARGEAGRQRRWRRLLVVEDPVDAVADPQRVLERLDVDVGGLGGDRVLDEEVHEPYHRRLEGHVAQMVDVLVAVGGALLVHALDDALERRGVGAVVIAVDRLENPRGRADDELDGQPGGLPEVVGHDRVERIGRGDGEHAALDGDRADPVLAQILGRDVLEHRHRGRQLLAPDVRQVLLHGECARDVVLVDGAEGDEGLADQLAGGPLARKGAIDGVGGGQPLGHEDLAKEAGRRSDGHAMLPTMLTYLAFAAVAAAADVAGAAIVTTAHKHGHARLRYFVAGGAGFMLAAAFIRMLPESAHVPHAFVFVLLGYFGVHLFEHTVAPHFHFGEEIHTEAFLRPSAAYLAVLGLGVHTLFDGVAITAGFMIGPTLGLLLFLAVLLHKLPEGFAIASIMLATGHSRGAAVLAGATLGALTVLGAWLTSFLAETHVSYALALSAGVTVYIAASDLIPEVNREGGPALAWTVFGGLVFFVLADWALGQVGLTR